MPRRKKNTKKKSLDFEESPKNIVRNLPSPVFGADNPPTADVVALDGNINIPWVSPDANLVRHPGTIRCRRSKRVNQKVDNTANVTLNHTRHRPNNKLRPLRFIGDETPKECSTAEDISVEELLSECEVEISRKGSVTRARLNTKRTRSYSNERNQRHDKELSQSDQSGTTRTWSPVLRTRTAKIRKTKRKMRGQKVKANLENLFTSDSDISLLENDNLQSPLRTETEVRSDGALSRLVQGDSSPVFGNVSDMRNLSHVSTPDLVQTEGYGRTPHRDEVPDARSNSHRKISSPYQDTHQRPLGRREKRGRRLFGACSINISNPSPGIRLKADAENLQSDFSPRLGSHYSPSKSLRRRSLRLMTLFTSCHSPARTSQHSAPHVLVYDTPEEDYGLPVRQRRLRDWKC